MVASEPPPAVMSVFIPARPDGTRSCQGSESSHTPRVCMSRDPIESSELCQPELNCQTEPLPNTSPPTADSSAPHMNSRICAGVAPCEPSYVVSRRTEGSSGLWL